MSNTIVRLIFISLLGSERNLSIQAFSLKKNTEQVTKLLYSKSLATRRSTSGFNMYKRFLNIQEPEGPSFSKKDVDSLRKHAFSPKDLHDKMDKRASIVLIGEGSHGTQECYQFRADLTKQLIENGKCNGVLIEGDFPDTALLHFYVTGMSSEMTLMQCLENYERFPSWLWANTVTRDFLEWLRNWNVQRSPEERCGIFGLDLYSVHLSIENVLEYLKIHDPEMCIQVRRDYAGFERLEPQTYGMLVERGLIKGCEKACVDALHKIAARTEMYAKEDPQNGLVAIDAAFFNEMNARVVVDAEHYYRAMFSSENSWNIRDTHFFDTMQRVIGHLKVSRGVDRGNVVLWAHNSHLGDARFTHLDDVPRRSHTKDLNIGQLVKETYPSDSLIIGQLFNTGKVCAADDWGSPHQYKIIIPALSNSHQHVLHTLCTRSGMDSLALDMSNSDVRNVFNEPRLQRAIGVIYRPETERWSHYYFCDIVNQFDYVVFYETTNPVIPLAEEEVKVPFGEIETYPSGL